MKLMNEVLKPFTSHCVVIYFNDILISKIEKDHLSYLKAVFETLRANQLFLNLKKCEFCSSQLLFLGFIVSSQGIMVDPRKIKAILS